jgi:hypothetical protein
MALPRSLDDAGNVALMGVLPEANAAQAELTVKTAGTAAQFAPVVGAHFELRFAFRLLD